ncbi:unnamed protein product [Rotaria magnacalcarata]|uniref:Uncharacterized protein n=1 Tax=Rotaria magnacalcarata TaxID=392030 RepID=A0A815TQC3_9BILA|nr:unnamed protein product [Rotaria magnacalcarata]CAF1503927.1 unnamed protein product [Rotaria magnacalcarata]CAF2111081.1 unnamed protein product [Rotaria magnacalcarata]CAF2129600.1 unnamed protein product [Rotaria magnacalcarata]CAF2163010.1 unnamed protein product [Rotaria magnacalcarata]
MKNSFKLSHYLPHHYQDNSYNDYPSDTKYPSICAGCNCQIYDQYLLKVAPDLEWHIQCLKCYECGQYLDEKTTCFVLDGKTFCKFDYIRLFVSKCAKCHQSFSKNDLFIRTTFYRRFHTDCFRCDHCDRLLTSGDEYYIHRQNEILCRQHFQQLSSNETSSTESKSSSSDSVGNPTAATNNNINNNNNNIPLRPLPTSSSSSAASSSSNQVTVGLSGSKSTNHGNTTRKDKTTRMRTVLNEKQLLTLRTCYSANPRPDALMKEQLVEMTQLSPRVIRVWFQNKRCKDKKKSILAKQTQEQQKVLSSLNHGIPLVASSPVSNDMNIGLPQASLVEVQYHPGGPWKTFNEAYPPFSNDYHSHSHQHHIQQRQPTFHDNVLSGFASEDDSNCFDASQFSEERSDNSCDGSATGQLTLL